MTRSSGSGSTASSKARFLPLLLDEPAGDGLLAGDFGFDLRYMKRPSAASLTKTRLAIAACSSESLEGSMTGSVSSDVALVGVLGLSAAGLGFGFMSWIAA